MIFFRDSESGSGVIDGFRERCEWRPGFNSDPENARSFCGGEESVAAECNLEGLGADAGKGALDLFHDFVRLLANEFQSDVKRLRTDPARIRREPAHTFHEALNALADGVVDVEGNEDSHKSKLSAISRQLSAMHADVSVLLRAEG